MMEMNEEKNGFHMEKGRDKTVKLRVAVLVLGILSSDTISVRKVRTKKLGVLLINGEGAGNERTAMLPKGDKNQGESLQKAAERILQEKTGLTGIRCEQFHTFDAPSEQEDNDPLCVYVALTDQTKQPLKDGFWTPADQPEEMGAASFDRRIIQTTLNCLRRHIYITDMVFWLMPEKFTLTELQELYEVILDQEIFPLEFVRNLDSQITETKEYSRTGVRREKLYLHTISECDI